MPPISRWFDSHLDLACIAACGRDMLSADLATCGGEDPPAAVTLPSLREGNVTHALGTIFTELGGKTPAISYPAGDAEAAHRAGLHQLDIYQSWMSAGEIAPLRTLPTISNPTLTPDASTSSRPKASTASSRGLRRLSDAPPESRVLASSDPEGVIGATCLSSASPDDFANPGKPQTKSPLHLGILIECADPIRTTDELQWWVDRGVIAIGLAWVHQGRYAGGNGTNHGLTDLGRALIREMDRLNIVHDASHLSDKSLHELFDLTDRPIIASHSNSRAILLSAPPSNTSASPAAAPNADIPPFQRHLTDAAIREITRRGGVIGLNLFSPFLIPGGPRDRRATLDEAIRHIDHICNITGDKNHIGLGSDMDGGFSAAMLPTGINRPAQLPLLADALSARNWSDNEIRAFTFDNWANFWNTP